MLASKYSESHSTTFRRNFVTHAFWDGIPFDPDSPLIGKENTVVRVRTQVLAPGTEPMNGRPKSLGIAADGI